MMLVVRCGETRHTCSCRVGQNGVAEASDGEPGGSHFPSGAKENEDSYSRGLALRFGRGPDKCAQGEQGSGESSAEKTHPVYEIALSEDSDYQSLPWLKQWMQGHEVEADCIGDGNLYLLKPGQGVVALTPNGVVSFLGDKMTDIPHPSTTFVGMNPSISPSGVAFRVTGIDEDKLEITTWTDEQGRPHTEKDATNATIPYMAQFDKDGTYKRGEIKNQAPRRTTEGTPR